jgi:tryptophan 2,3-dioxygenase
MEHVNMTEENSTLTYAEYLQLSKILSAQRLLSTEHSEMLFIVSHQVYELWFKQTLHELKLLQSQLEAGNTSHALRSLRRILAIFRVMITQLEVLEAMTPTQFNEFRSRLGPSSGFESAQFREIEAVLGRRDERVIARYPEGSPERGRIAAAMSRPSLFDSFVRYLQTQGYVVPAEIRDREVSAPAVPCVDLQKILVKLYVADLEPVGICEYLVDLDEAMQEWRYCHVKMVERIIGAKRGSAGSAGAAYLKTTLGKPAFPDLWDIRTLF